jgi:3-oxoacyl-[acyl-carrier protein] reductase
MKQLLAGKTAIITGAGSGLGAALARALASEGARCVLAGRRLGPLQAVGAEIQSTGGVAHSFAADVGDEAQIEALVREAAEVFGGIDILVNNAGVFKTAPLMETSTALWDETMAVNLRGVFLLCRTCWPHLMKRGGQIVNVSSVAGVQGYADEAAYCASKFGLNGLTKVLALEGKALNIRAFAVCPGAVDTPMWKGEAPPGVMARMMKPEAIAELVRWMLTSPRSLDFGPVVVRNFHDPWEDGE